MCGTLQTLHDAASRWPLTAAAAAMRPAQPLRSSLPLLPSLSHTLPTWQPQVGDVLVEERRPPRPLPAGQVPEQRLQAGAQPRLVKPDLASEGLGPPCLLQRVSLLPSIRVHTETCAAAPAAAILALSSGFIVECLLIATPPFCMVHASCTAHPMPGIRHLPSGQAGPPSAQSPLAGKHQCIPSRVHLSVLPFD